ncbi:aryl-sulfate sulfotransferase [Flagellimonas myxillae]|uniref:aryl-sulfate sulfotransferase n=1 Tax=Flagellimonas myxillae TaxID=2942214 RepID=UPI00201E8D99|nr:aryl-sulfate sulfotransferase [Muricauda myxillae]MCL6264945.1 aryl-sulfate sulfotransferase [Muricauda myxillae]
MKRTFRLILASLLSILFLMNACNSDDPPTIVIDDTPGETPTDDEPTDDEPTDDEPTDDEPVDPPGVGEEAGTVEFLNEDLVSDGYVLINDAGADRVYLMDKNSIILYEWDLPFGIGNDVELLPDGRLLGIMKAEEPDIQYGGQGGKLQFINPDSSVDWNFDYSTPEHITHHDVELLPNGNVLTIVWERKTAEEAEQAGSSLAIDVFPEAIIEVNPATDQIVWEWHAWDHIIQDHDDTKENFGVIADNPNRINLNYVTDKEGDIMHANGLEYDENNDLIFLSVNFYHEVWVIDHSTSTEEAASNSGGNYGLGGNLVYRFGNPKAYDNAMGERLFRNNHHPRLLDGMDLGKFSIYSNGADLEQSTAYELQLPDPLELQVNTDNEPAVAWSFTDEALYAPRVSGMVRISSGNRLITEGDFGVWEVTEAGEVVWKFHTPGFYWRSYHYDTDHPGIVALGL